MVKKALLGQVSDAEIRLLRIFRAVVACGGLAAAELDLNIGRSTISRHLKDLEDRLGLVLCRRGRAGFALTADGQRVHERALALLDALDAFRGEVRDMHADLQGTLELGLFDKTATNPACRIPQALGDFRAAAPQVGLDVLVGGLTEIESRVLDGRLHLGVLPDHRRSESLAYTDLFGETMLLYCGREHALFDAGDVSAQRLRAFDYAGFGFHSPNMEATHRFGLRRTATVNDQEAVATLILSGRFIGFLPDHYAAGFEQLGHMRHIAPACRYEVRFVALTRRGDAPSRLGQAFLEALLRAHRPAGA